jgi:tellurite methyltransferase
MVERWKFWKHTDNPWPTYSERTKDRDPRELLVQAVAFARGRDHALDLGSGALNESKFLLDQGFKLVTAVNKDPLDIDPIAKARAESYPKDRFEYRVSPFDAFDFQTDTYDLINAQYSLAFNPPETFDRMFGSLKASLKQGGIVTGQFFGPHDEWSGNRKMTFITREKAEKLLEGFEILHFKEIEGPDNLAVGSTKHWHTLHFIAQKK